MARWKLQAVPPVEHRLLGLDRRLIWPTVCVFLVVLFWSGVMPAIDEAVDQREVEAGTVYDVGPARFTPTPGWVLVEPPSPVGESTSAAVFKDGVTFRVKGGLWNKTAEELLARVAEDQDELFVEGITIPVTTSQKVAGVAKRINGPYYTGLLIAYVDDAGRGVEVIVKGPVDASEQLAQPIADMIKSIAFEAEDA